ncbi:MAG TPA: TolC family protein [Bryobacteraceae bacterium]|nr:TolC family protein [Bryobacteraceae bacterium]
MIYPRSLTTFLVLILALSAAAQTSEVSIEEPKLPPVIGPLIKPFHVQRRIVSPAKLSDTRRLESLVRAGNLYLSVQDVIALTLENNIDIAVQRYAPFLSREVLRRTESGQFLRNVVQPISPGPQSVSLAGVTSTTVGLPDTGSGVSSGGGLVISIGTTPPTLDPILFASANFQHQTSPESNTLLAGVSALVNDTRAFTAGYFQQFITGTLGQLTFSSTRYHLNSPAFQTNPFTSGSLDFFVQQPLLQGFSIAASNRYIRVAKNNMKVSDLQLKRQVITTVSAVLNLYWDLVSFNDDLRIREQALATAQKLLEDNQHQVELGTLPKIEVTRAQAEVSSTKENLLIAQTNVSQQEIVLKNALSRNGVASPNMDEVHVITLDQIVVPAKEDLKPTPELIDQALHARTELEQFRINLESYKINLAGTKNGLLPTLSAFAEFTNNGLSGDPNALTPGVIPPQFAIGGYGNFLAQIFQRHFPNYSAGFSLNIPFRNRQPQADYVTDLLTVRQNELLLQKAINQVRVDVKNAVIGLQQARARYETAVATRTLAQQTLEAEQNRFKFGESTIALVVQSQRDLANNQEAEIQAMANYTHAKIAFDDAVGQSLEVNNISMDEAAAGRVTRDSAIPEQIPEKK